MKKQCNYFIIEIFQNGRYGLQDACRRDRIAVFFVPSIQNIHIHSLTIEFCPQHFQFRTQNVGWNWSVAIFLAQKYLKYCFCRF